MKRSDEYKVQVSDKSGLIDYSENEGDKCMVTMPYAMKMLIQELQTMCIYPRLEIDTDISNKPVFKYLVNNLME